MIHTKTPLVFCIIVSLAAHLLLITGLGARFWSSGEGVGGRLNARVLPRTFLKTGRAGAPVSVDNARVPESQRVQEPEFASTSTVVPSKSIGNGQFIVPLVDRYLPISQLTVTPTPLGPIDPTPLGLKIDGVVGEAELMLLISSEGSVDEVLTVRSSLPEPLVDYARAVFKEASFNPGRVNEIAVRSRIRVLISPNISSSVRDAGYRSSLKNSEREINTEQHGIQNPARPGLN